MQEVTRQRGFAGNLGRGAVKAVANHGVTDTRQVYADLVRAAGADPHLEIREAGETAEHVVLGPGGAAACEPGSHADALPRVARDGLFDAAALRLDVPMH